GEAPAVASAPPRPPAASEPAPASRPAHAEVDEAILLPESEVLLAEIEAAWKQIIDDIKPYNPTVQALLRSCDPISVTDDVLVIGAQSPFHQRKLEDIANRTLVEDIITKHIKHRIQMRCELITNEQKSRASDARKQREDLMKDNMVRYARNIFDARIVGVQDDQSAT
ncbi:MAG TPA: DNA polymerase III subunit gamma/tau, partial [Herpetosiphonaceae bacterium]